jgi:hypothetical protein
MNPNQVAALATYTQQHHPEAFGQAMAEAGHQQPDLLPHLLGEQGLQSVAQRIIGHRMSGG